MKHIFSAIKKLTKSNRKSYQNSDQILTKRERQHLTIAITIIFTPFIIGSFIYLIG